ncbi:hypothetical protein F52700_6749 [Fusarium sp. NRRL 52700]|nr:hypothetical protein F52700_6749 [Fusarium sp. NRRL 52700]
MSLSDQRQRQQQQPWWMPEFLDSQESLDPAQASQTGPFWLVPLKVGDFGIIHTSGDNSFNDGGLIDYPIVQLLRKTDKGIEAGYGTTRLGGRAGLSQVPRENIILGASLTGPGRVDLVQDVMDPPRILFNSTFKNFDCYIHHLDATGPRHAWIRTKAPPTVDTPAIWSFRARCTLKHHSERGHGPRVRLFCSQSSLDSKIGLFEPTVPLQDDIPLRDVYALDVIIEITIGTDVKHPHSYIPPQRAGSFDSWSQAFRVAIRIEFQDRGGLMKAQYLHSPRINPVLSRYRSLKVEDLGNELNHMDVSWLYCIKTLATLLNWRWKPENNPVRENLTQAVWAPYYIRLFSIDFDFHNQRLVLDEPQSVEMQCPRLVAPLEETSSSFIQGSTDLDEDP